jgi:gamma-glutamylcyclotransferase (GGCT)/AIG2-like uncharacterized protein YtfP
MNTDTFTLTDLEAIAAEASIPRQVFVYGTLRPNQGNDRLWEGLAYAKYDGKCKVLGHRLVSNGAFPYMIPAATEEAFGCLVVPLPDQYDYVLGQMDRLEGVPHHYTRETVAVMTPEGIELAWTYIPRNPETYAALGDVPGNDWVLHKRRIHSTHNVDGWSSL